jgi:hypothetical protein
VAPEAAQPSGRVGEDAVSATHGARSQIHAVTAVIGAAAQPVGDVQEIGIAGDGELDGVVGFIGTGKDAAAIAHAETMTGEEFSGRKRNLHEREAREKKNTDPGKGRTDPGISKNKNYYHIPPFRLQAGRFIP